MKALLKNPSNMWVSLGMALLIGCSNSQSLNKPEGAPKTLIQTPAAPKVPPATTQKGDYSAESFPVCTSLDGEDAANPVATNSVAINYLAVATNATWPREQNTLRVRFFNGSPELHDRILYFASEWTNYTGIQFVKVESGFAEIRVRIFDGTPEGGTDRSSWSLLGTQALTVPQTQPTMNLGSLHLRLSDDYMRGIVQHEFGHALGWQHEHQNPASGIQWNVDKVYEFFANRYPRNVIETNILAKLNINTTNYTQFDPNSVMLYSFPPEITLNGVGTKLNTRISDTDKSHGATIYPPKPNQVLLPISLNGVQDFAFDVSGRPWLSRGNDLLFRHQAQTWASAHFINPTFAPSVSHPEQGSSRRYAFIYTPGFTYATVQMHPGTPTGTWSVVPDVPPFMKAPVGLIATDDTNKTLYTHVRGSQQIFRLNFTEAAQFPNGQFALGATTALWQPLPLLPGTVVPAKMTATQNELWVLGRDARIYRLGAAATQWQQVAFPTTPQSLDSQGGVLWAVDTAGALRRRVATGWEPVTAPAAVHVALAPRGRAFLQSPDGTLHMWEGQGWRPQGQAPLALALKADPYGNPWLLRSDGTLGVWHTNTGRQQPQPFAGMAASSFASEVLLAHRKNLIPAGLVGATWPTNAPLTREQGGALVAQLLQAFPNVRVGAGPFPTPAWPDVTPSRWSAAPIGRLVALVLMRGHPLGHFSPTTPLYRGELAHLLLETVKVMRKARGLAEMSPLMANTSQSPFLWNISNTKDHWAERAALSMGAYCHAAIGEVQEAWLDPDTPATLDYAVAMVSRTHRCLTDELK